MSRTSRATCWPRAVTTCCACRRNSIRSGGVRHRSAGVTQAHLMGPKTTLSSYRSPAQYQERPSPAEGGVFKRSWWRFWRPAHRELPPVQVRMADGTVESIAAVSLPERFDEMVQSWDLAFKDLET